MASLHSQVLQVADGMVDSGLKDAGFEYINLDAGTQKGANSATPQEISLKHSGTLVLLQTLILYGRSPAGTQIRNKKRSRPEPEVVLTHCADILHLLLLFNTFSYGSHFYSKAPNCHSTMGPTDDFFDLPAEVLLFIGSSAFWTGAVMQVGMRGLGLELATRVRVELFLMGGGTLGAALVSATGPTGAHSPRFGLSLACMALASSGACGMAVGGIYNYATPERLGLAGVGLVGLWMLRRCVVKGK